MNVYLSNFKIQLKREKRLLRKLGGVCVGGGWVKGTAYDLSNHFIYVSTILGAKLVWVNKVGWNPVL